MPNRRLMGSDGCDASRMHRVSGPMGVWGDGPGRSAVEPALRRPAWHHFEMMAVTGSPVAPSSIQTDDFSGVSLPLTM